MAIGKDKTSVQATVKTTTRDAIQEIKKTTQQSESKIAGAILDRHFAPKEYKTGQEHLGLVKDSYKYTSDLIKDTQLDIREDDLKMIGKMMDEANAQFPTDLQRAMAKGGMEEVLRIRNNERSGEKG